MNQFQKTAVLYKYINIFLPHYKQSNCVKKNTPFCIFDDNFVNSKKNMKTTVVIKEKEAYQLTI